MDLNLDNQQLMQRLLRERDTFLAPPEPRRKPTWRPDAPAPTGHRVELVVRRRGSISEHLFVHDSPKLSQLEARIDAEREAREAGYPIVGRIHDIRRR